MLNEWWLSLPYTTYRWAAIRTIMQREFLGLDHARSHIHWQPPHILVWDYAVSRKWSTMIMCFWVALVNNCHQLPSIANCSKPSSNNINHHKPPLSTIFGSYITTRIQEYPTIATGASTIVLSIIFHQYTSHFYPLLTTIVYCHPLLPVTDVWKLLWVSAFVWCIAWS